MYLGLLPYLFTYPAQTKTIRFATSLPLGSFTSTTTTTSGSPTRTNPFLSGPSSADSSRAPTVHQTSSLQRPLSLSLPRSPCCEGQFCRLHLVVGREFSAAASKTSSHHPGGAPNPPPGKGGSRAKIFLGSAAVGAGFVAAYKTGYLDPIFGAKEKSDSVKDAAIGFEDHKHVGEEKHDEERAGIAEEKVETQSDVPNVEGLSGIIGKNPQSRVADGNKPESDIASEKGLPEYSQNANLGSSSEGNVDVKSVEEETSVEKNEVIQTPRVVSQTNADQQENEAKTPPPQHDITEDKAQVALGIGEEPSQVLSSRHII